MSEGTGKRSDTRTSFADSFDPCSSLVATLSDTYGQTVIARLAPRRESSDSRTD